MMKLRPDLKIISNWIKPGSRVLDLGCGDGTLLAYLRDHRDIAGYGLEIDDDNIVKSINKRVNVLQTNLDAGLSDFEANSFEYVVMTQTLQAIHRPDLLLDEMLRVGQEGIVTFPNFGHWQVRLDVGLNGSMPVSRSLPNEWYSTPNIHLCTVKDFERLCKKKNITILQRSVVNHAHQTTVGMRLFPNLLGEFALYRFSRNGK
ncbi:MAG: methionine biosynthesis protein MetW [Gammaproteobacteria bacterium]